jgi:hypothetical protein
MIYIFRKEMKKWHSVLWVVFASLALSGTFFVWRSASVDDIEIATVNGETITLKKYRQALNDLQGRIGMLKEYAGMYGLSEDIFLKSILGDSSVYDVAFNDCVREFLVDKIKDTFNIQVDNRFFKEELVKSLPPGILDESGKVNIGAYTAHIERQNITVSDFEEKKEEEFKRAIIEQLVSNSFYSPSFSAKGNVLQDNSKKSFKIVPFNFNDFLKKAKAEVMAEEKLKTFFDEHKDSFRIPEKRKAKYWQISPEDYAKEVKVEDWAIEQFYEKNKSSFRIPPKIKVRHILLSVPGSDAKPKMPTDKQKVEFLNKAKDLQELIKSSPDRFAELAEKHSSDASTAKEGGLTKLFGRGTFDADFEKAAFGLQNKGDLSEIVETKNGFEIIQLNERIKAADKPLKDVKDEIVKTLRSKKSLFSLESELKTVLHKSKSDDKAIYDFTKKYNLKELETGWLFKDRSSKRDFEGQVSEMLFSKRKITTEKGYFLFEGKYVIYVRSGTEAGFIQKYNDVKEKVKEQFCLTQARSEMKKSIDNFREDFFNKKKSLEEIVREKGLSIINTDLLKKGDKIKNIENSDDMNNKIFILSSSEQLLRHKHGDDYFLVQVEKEVVADLKDLGAEQDKLIRNEKLKNGRAHLGGFIASLHRNAKIDKNKSVMNAYKSS